MKLYVKFLKNVENVNNFQYTDNWDISEGSAHRLYYQLVDKHKDSLRFMSQASIVTSSVTFLSIDEQNEIVANATQAFSDDKSIFYIDLTSNQVPNSGAVKFSLIQDGEETKIKVDHAIVVDLLNNGGC